MPYSLVGSNTDQVCCQHVILGKDCILSYYQLFMASKVKGYTDGVLFTKNISQSTLFTLIFSLHLYFLNENYEYYD
jgi:hypothetical protein